LPFAGSRNYTFQPKGCYLWARDTFFNVHPDGVPNNESTPLCGALRWTPSRIFHMRSMRRDWLQACSTSPSARGSAAAQATARTT
jgi:hypothetical protein